MSVGFVSPTQDFAVFLRLVGMSFRTSPLSRMSAPAADLVAENFRQSFPSKAEKDFAHRTLSSHSRPSDLGPVPQSHR